MTCACHRYRVVHQETTAHGVARNVQSLNRLFVLVKRVTFRIAIDSADQHEHAGIAERNRIERRILYGEQARRHLGEVGVFASMRQLVVTINLDKASAGTLMALASASIVSAGTMVPASTSLWKYVSDA